MSILDPQKDLLRKRTREEPFAVMWSLVLSVAALCVIWYIFPEEEQMLHYLVQPEKARGAEVMVELPLSGLGFCLPARDRENVWANAWIIKRHRNKKCPWVSTGREARLGMG